MVLPKGSSTQPETLAHLCMTPTNLIFTQEQIAALAESWKNKEKKKVALVFPRERLSSPAHCAARGSRVPPHSRPLLASACRTTYSDIPAGPRALPRPALGVLNLNRELTRSGMMPCRRAGHRRAVAAQTGSEQAPPSSSRSCGHSRGGRIFRPAPSSPYPRGAEH